MTNCETIARRRWYAMLDEMDNNGQDALTSDPASTDDSSPGCGPKTMEIMLTWTDTIRTIRDDLPPIHDPIWHTDVFQATEHCVDGVGVLTTEHPSSSYGQPVLVVRGRAYGAADIVDPAVGDSAGMVVLRCHHQWPAAHVLAMSRFGRAGCPKN